MNTIKLEDGRELALEPVAPHEAMELAQGCRHLSGVHHWWQMAMAMGAVRMIDRIPIPFPTHEKHVEGMVSRFSRPDLRVIAEALKTLVNEAISPEIEIAELTPLETLRIWALIGEFETIAGWILPAFTAATVRKINDNKVQLPSTKAEMKALVALLGHAGMSKVSDLLVAQEMAAKAAAADKLAAAKN